MAMKKTMTKSSVRKGTRARKTQVHQKKKVKATNDWFMDQMEEYGHIFEPIVNPKQEKND